MIWVILFAGGALTYGIRLSMLVFVHHSSLPAALRDGLRYVAPAVMAAFVLPAVLYAGDSGDLDVSAGNERLIAALLAATVAWVTRNTYLTIGAGMVALWTLQALA